LKFTDSTFFEVRKDAVWLVTQSIMAKPIAYLCGYFCTTQSTSDILATFTNNMRVGCVDVDLFGPRIAALTDEEEATLSSRGYRWSADVTMEKGPLQNHKGLSLKLSTLSPGEEAGYQKYFKQKRVFPASTSPASFNGEEGSYLLV
jgi:hypothetical protein